MRKKENTDHSKRNDNSFFQQISPFNKSIKIQIISLSISIISAFLGLYYIFYQQSIDVFIYEGILPYRLNWMLYFIGVSVLALIGLLFMPLDESYFIKKELIDKVPLILKNIEVKFHEELFHDAINIIETYFDELHSIHIFKKNKKLLLLYKQAQINNNLKILLKKINELLMANALREFTQEIRSALTFIEINNEYILESQKKKFEEISNRSRING